MKKFREDWTGILILLGAFAFALMLYLFSSCDKQIKCHREVTKTINNQVVYFFEEDFYVDYVTCNECMVYEKVYYDTIISSKIKCK